MRYEVLVIVSPEGCTDDQLHEATGRLLDAGHAARRVMAGAGARFVSLRVAAGSMDEAMTQATALVSDAVLKVTGNRVHAEYGGSVSRVEETQDDRVRQMADKLLAIGRRNGYVAPPGTQDFDARGSHQEAREIGRTLDRLGGKAAMLQAHERVARELRDERRALELWLCWAGIGEWPPLPPDIFHHG